MALPQQFWPVQPVAFDKEKALWAIQRGSVTKATPQAIPVKRVLPMWQQPQAPKPKILSMDKYEAMLSDAKKAWVPQKAIDEEIKAKWYEVDKPKWFFWNMKERATERAWKVTDIIWATNRWEQTTIEWAWQLLWQSAWLFGDALGDLMIRWAKELREVTPQYLKKPLDAWVKATLSNPTVQSGIKSLTKGIESYNERAKENPRAARNLWAVYNIWEVAVDLFAGWVAWRGAKAWVEQWIKQTGKWLRTASKYTIEPLAKWVEKVTTWVLWLTTWTSPDTIRQALKSAGSEWFVKWLRGKIDETDVLTKVKSAVANLKEDRSTLYGKWYDKLLEATDQVDISDIKNWLDDELFGAKGLKLWKTDKGIDFAQSTISRWSPQQKVIQNLVSDIEGRTDYTPAWLDILKKRVDDYFKWTAEFAQTDRLVSKVRNQINDKIKQVVPEYAEMNKKYSEMSTLLKNIDWALAVWWKKETATAITKLKGALRRNQEYRQQIIKEINRYTNGDILGELAWTSLSDYMPRWLIWVLAWWGALVNPTFLAWLAAASPRIIGELANIIGISTKKLKLAINKASDIVEKTWRSLDKAIPNDIPFDLSTAVDSISTLPVDDNTRTSD